MDISHPYTARLYFDACNWIGCSDNYQLDRYLVEIEIYEKVTDYGGFIDPGSMDYSAGFIGLPEKLSFTTSDVIEGTYTYLWPEIFTLDLSYTID